MRGRTAPTAKRGFTLVEMAVVLIIIGLLILTVFPALIASRSAGQRAATLGNLQALMQATAAFVQANGCLPCPTPAATSGAGFGRVRGDTAAASCNGCAAPEGIPPFVSLGLSATVAHDGWGRWISMRVDPALTAAKLNIVPPAAICTSADLAASTATCALQGAAQKGLCQSGLATASRVSVQTPLGATQNVAVLFVSYGSQGYGSFLAAANPLNTGYNNGCRLSFPSLATACKQSLACSSPATGLAYAQCNATGANSFYNPPPQNGYDDLMLYADRNTLVSMLGNGSACNTVW